MFAAVIASECVVAAQQIPTEVLSVGVAKPLMAAEEATRKRNWQAALDDIRQAQSTANKTDKDEYNIDDLLAYVLYRQNKYDQAADV